MFEVIPAIDISGGQVVRLTRGEPGARAVYGDDPAAVARRWAAEGARRLHVVDLDGAFEGRPVNAEAVAAVIGAAGVPVQVGGGIRNLQTASWLVGAGADRVVLGTAALTDRAFLGAALEAFGDRVVVALDARGGEVRLAGWTRGSGVEVVEAARELARAGVPRLLCTDISRDGTMRGPNLELLARVAEAAGVPVLASGGVGSPEDVRAVAALAPLGVEGVVVGKALYEGAVVLREAGAG